MANVAHLPGILCCSLAMPDIHFGYGFPIGGVAAFGVDDGVVSPGGVGYDINCGVRLLATDLDVDDLQGKIKPLVDQLFRDVPSGVGSSGAIAKLPRKEMESVLVKGRGLGGRARLRLPGRPRPHRGRRGPPRRRPGRGERARLHPRARTRWARSARATTSSRSRWSTRSSTRRRRPPTGCTRDRSRS